MATDLGKDRARAVIGSTRRARTVHLIAYRSYNCAGMGCVSITARMFPAREGGLAVVENSVDATLVIGVGETVGDKSTGRSGA
jgi:hypothetical protein